MLKSVKHVRINYDGLKMFGFVCKILDVTIGAVL